MGSTTGGTPVDVMQLEDGTGLIDHSMHQHSADDSAGSMMHHMMSMAVCI